MAGAILLLEIILAEVRVQRRRAVGVPPAGERRGEGAGAELAREGHQVERWNLLHPTEERRLSHVQKCLKDTQGPVIASTDYVRALVDQIRGQIDRRFVVLGTDGFGRSDTREKLRHFFEVDRHWVTVAALNALADEGTIERKVVADAIAKYNLDPSKPNPMTV